MSGSTPNRAIPYPTSSDLVADGAQAMQDLATAVDTELGPRTAFTAYLAANLSVSHALWNTLTGWSEVVDRGADLDPATGIYTAPVAGVYLFTGNVFWQSNGTGARYTALWRADNAGGIFAEVPGVAQFSQSGIDPRQAVSALLHMAAGDRVKMQVFQTSGAALNVIGAADYGADNAARFGGALVQAD